MTITICVNRNIWLIHCMISEKWYYVHRYEFGSKFLCIWTCMKERHVIMHRINKRQGSNATSCTVDQWFLPTVHWDWHHHPDNKNTKATPAGLWATTAGRTSTFNKVRGLDSYHHHRSTLEMERVGPRGEEKKACLLSVLKCFMDLWSSLRCRVREMKPIPSLDLGNVAGPAERDLCRGATNPRGPASYKAWKSQVDLTVQFYVLYWFWFVAFHHIQGLVDIAITWRKYCGSVALLPWSICILAWKKCVLF